MFIRHSRRVLATISDDTLDAVAAAARQSGARIRVGFNHRYHRAFREAREIFESGALGELMFIRARYGQERRIRGKRRNRRRAGRAAERQRQVSEADLG